MLQGRICLKSESGESLKGVHFYSDKEAKSVTVIFDERYVFELFSFKRDAVCFQTKGQSIF